MFELVQHPQWPPKRPERSGFLAISIFCITVTLGFVARDHILINPKHYESKNGATSDQALERDKHSGMPDVEIKRWQVMTNVPVPKPPKRALKCRCHIDTQVAGQTINHHSSQFAMCKLVTQSDQEWHRGFFDRRQVLIRWHCTEQ
jgi:hypothetical protein